MQENTWRLGLMALALAAACGGQTDDSTSKPGTGGTGTDSAPQSGTTDGGTSGVIDGGDSAGAASGAVGGPNGTTTATECLYDGVAYRIGAQVVLAGACRQCTCLPNGTMSCDLLECVANCRYNDVDHRLGEQLPVSDGCNVCTCEAAGFTCTHDVCGPCIDGGHTYAYGASFYRVSAGSCTRCVCGKNGVGNCTLPCPSGDD